MLALVVAQAGEDEPFLKATVLGHLSVFWARTWPRVVVGVAFDGALSLYTMDPFANNTGRCGFGGVRPVHLGRIHGRDLGIGKMPALTGAAYRSVVPRDLRGCHVLADVYVNPRAMKCKGFLVIRAVLDTRKWGKTTDTIKTVTVNFRLRAGLSNDGGGHLWSVGNRLWRTRLVELLVVAAAVTVATQAALAFGVRDESTVLCKGSECQERFNSDDPGDFAMLQHDEMPVHLSCPKGCYYALDDQIIRQFTVMYSRKALGDLLDTTIRRLHSSGLIDVWLRRDGTKQKPPMRTRRMDSLADAFYLLGSGLAVGSVALVVEVTTYRLSPRRAIREPEKGTFSKLACPTIKPSTSRFAERASQANHVHANSLNLKLEEAFNR
ncbi:hypothetical protein ONE63_004533 [Megalurothrips usitatus]|uniref:Uncharacterized protein n=1 Tax=Megalurothrips usitatus TaxID=439358 RepID=A0AAV7XA08_9NEOP|nr:hypothetical protein ONE63_004533 [Megalurothrips usitatus]